MDKIEELLTRGVVNIIPNKDSLKKLLDSGKKLNIYLGIDPTATRIHLGHAVPLRKLQALVKLGHNVKFLIGDFTALVGDSSDKESERPILTAEEIKENFQTYKEQAEKILDFSRVSVVFNGEWLSKLGFADIIKLCQHFSVGDFIGRELIKKRLTEGRQVRLDEMLYPVMQGYDSYHLDTDIQVGSADQTFNMQAGRTLQHDLRDKESFVLVTDYLTGTDGRKMSKSWGNAIWLTDDPKEMYGKVMSLKDDLIIQYFTLATAVPMTEIKEFKEKIEKGENPMNIKKKLAFTIVSELHDAVEAEKAQENFEHTFQHGEFSRETKTILSQKTLIETIAQIPEVGSKSEAKRLINAGAVDVGGENIIDTGFPVKDGDNIKIGKKIFVKVEA